MAVLFPLGIVGLVAADGMAVFATDPYIGVAAIISAFFAGLATLIGALNRQNIRRTEKKADHAIERVEVSRAQMTEGLADQTEELKRHVARVEPVYDGMRTAQDRGARATEALLDFLKRNDVP